MFSFQYQQIIVTQAMEQEGVTHTQEETLHLLAAIALLPLYPPLSNH